MKKNDLDNNNMNMDEIQRVMQEQMELQMKEYSQPMLQQMMIQRLNLDVKIKIKIIFRRIWDFEDTNPIVIESFPDEKVSTIIEVYRNKSFDLEPNKKFLFNAKDLNPNLYLSEAGITNNSNIFVVKFEKIRENI